MCILNWLSENWFEIIRLIFILAGFYFAYWLVIKRDKLWYRRDDRTRIKEVNDWFHETYILNGVDPVLAYISLLKIQDPIQFIGIEDLLRKARADEPDFPMEPLNRLNKILGDNIEKLILDIRFNCYYPPPFPYDTAEGIAVIEEYQEHTQNRLEKIKHLLSGLGHELLGIELDNKLSTKGISDYPVIQPYKKRCKKILNNKFVRK